MAMNMTADCKGSERVLVHFLVAAFSFLVINKLVSAGEHGKGWHEQLATSQLVSTTFSQHFPPRAESIEHRGPGVRAGTYPE